MLSQLDTQMMNYEKQLKNDFSFDPDQVKKLCSIVYYEIAKLSEDKKDQIRNSSKIPFSSITDEIKAFENWMIYANSIKDNPFITRAQVIVQNYICFAYLKDSLFKTLKQLLPKPNIIGFLCEYLTNDPIYAFRNAFAHGNWKYLADFSGLEFWAKEQSKKAEIKHWIVKQDEMGYWQALSRCVAYSAILSLEKDLNALHLRH